MRTFAEFFAVAVFSFYPVFEYQDFLPDIEGTHFFSTCLGPWHWFSQILLLVHFRMVHLRGAPTHFSVVWGRGGWIVCNAEDFLLESPKVFPARKRIDCLPVCFLFPVCLRPKSGFPDKLRSKAIVTPLTVIPDALLVLP